MHGCIQDQVFADEEPTITAQDLFVDGTPFYNNYFWNC
jgi:hypothetical protein